MKMNTSYNTQYLREPSLDFGTVFSLLTIEDERDALANSPLPPAPPPAPPPPRLFCTTGACIIAFL